TIRNERDPLREHASICTVPDGPNTGADWRVVGKSEVGDRETLPAQRAVALGSVNLALRGYFFQFEDYTHVYPISFSLLARPLVLSSSSPCRSRLIQLALQLQELPQLFHAWRVIGPCDPQAYLCLGCGCFGLLLDHDIDRNISRDHNHDVLRHGDL